MRYSVTQKRLWDLSLSAVRETLASLDERDDQPAILQWVCPSNCAARFLVLRIYKGHAESLS